MDIGEDAGITGWWQSFRPDNTTLGGGGGEGRVGFFSPGLCEKSRVVKRPPVPGFEWPFNRKRGRAPNKSGINYAGHAEHVVF